MIRGRKQNSVSLDRARRLRRSAELKLLRSEREMREREREAESRRRLRQEASE